VEPDVNVAFKLVADGEAEIGVLNFHINGLRFLQPRANHSPYLGVGLGWGVVSFDTEDGSGEGQGFQGHVFGGYEFFRASSIRMLLQVDQEVPAYGVGPGWAPLTAISVGFGYNAIHFERQRYHHRPWGAR